MTIYMRNKTKITDFILDSPCIIANRKEELRTKPISELIIIIDDHEKNFYEQTKAELIKRIIDNKYDVEEQ